MSILDAPEYEKYTNEEAIQRANTAVRLLEEPVMAEAWQDIERALLLKSLHADTADEREDARRSVLLIASVREALHKLVSDGEYAARFRERIL